MAYHVGASFLYSQENTVDSLGREFRFSQNMTYAGADILKLVLRRRERHKNLFYRFSCHGFETASRRAKSMSRK
jgi:hypothetical protein